MRIDAVVELTLRLPRLVFARRPAAGARAAARRRSACRGRAALPRIPWTALLVVERVIAPAARSRSGGSDRALVLVVHAGTARGSAAGTRARGRRRTATGSPSRAARSGPAASPRASAGLSVIRVWLPAPIARRNWVAKSEALRRLDVQRVERQRRRCRAAGSRSRERAALQQQGER